MTASRTKEQLVLFEPSEAPAAPPVRELVLSKDQAEVYSSMRDWAARPKGILRVGGYAGTGKTTLLGKFAAENKLLVAYVAYTGRAASILSRKLKEGGVATTGKTLGPKSSKVSYTRGAPDAKLPFVGTIHRLLYRPVIHPVTEELLGWKKRDTLDRAYDVIVVDEASMVGDEILYDLKELGAPILAVGDHGQLPPVMDSGRLMQNPDLRLEHIHRQALGSPIIALSQHVREGEWLDDFDGIVKNKHGEIVFARKKDVVEVIERAYRKRPARDVIVVSWTNRTRVMLNGAARRALGYKGAPQEGEVVVCLKNYPPVMNGMRGLLVENSAPGGKWWHLAMKLDFPEDGIEAESVVANATQFNRKGTYDNVEELAERGISVDKMSDGGMLYDFGYALTAHKCQGSQAGHVIVFVDMPEKPKQEQWRRWIYTAVTRASEKLTILVR